MDGIELTFNSLGHSLYTKGLFSKMRHCLQLSSQHIFMSIVHQIDVFVILHFAESSYKQFSVQVYYLQIKGGYWPR